jgi:hypothetical protein
MHCKHFTNNAAGLDSAHCTVTHGACCAAHAAPTYTHEFEAPQQHNTLLHWPATTLEAAGCTAALPHLCVNAVVACQPGQSAGTEARLKRDVEATWQQQQQQQVQQLHGCKLRGW